MTTPQVNPVGVPSLLSVKTKVPKENGPSFSETLKPLEQKSKEDNNKLDSALKETKFQKNEKPKETVMEKEVKEKVVYEGEEAKTKEALISGEQTETEKPLEQNDLEPKALSILSEEEDGAKEVLMSLLVNFIRDLSLKIGVKEEEIKDYLVNAGIEVSKLLDIDTWKGFTLKLNDLSDMSEMLTNDKAFQELTLISDFLNQMVDAGEMKQLTTRLTEGSLKFEDLLRDYDKEVEFLLNSQSERADSVSEEEMIQPLLEDVDILPLSQKEEKGLDFASGKRGNSNEGTGQLRDGSHVLPVGNRLFDNLVTAIHKLEGSERLPEGLTSREILTQVTEQIKTLHAPDKTTLELMLQPATLGKVLINVTSKNGIMQAELRVENPEAKQALMNNLADLKLSFENQGFKVEEIEVMLAEAGIGQQDEERGQAGEERKNKRKAEKINFLEEDDTEEVFGSDKPLRVDSSMGTAVDYSA